MVVLFRTNFTYTGCIDKRLVYTVREITVISLEIWRFINYITYLLTIQYTLHSTFLNYICLKTRY